MRGIFDAAPLRKSEIFVICQSAQFVNPLNSQRATKVMMGKPVVASVTSVNTRKNEHW